MIDFHAHLGNLFREQYPRKVPLTVHQLIDRMNREGIARSVLLLLESPEGSWGYSLTEEVVAARDRYPERLIAFVCVDPRYPHAPEFIDYFVRHHDCRGFGEHVNGLAFDDERNRAIYKKCDELGLPLVFEINDSMCWDEVGLPRLEKCLQDIPNVTFVGHGPGFWSAISADDPRQGYPTGRIVKGGALDRLLAAYENLYADLSAYSGFNAMTRDPEFTYGFLRRHWRKLLWGTDIVSPSDPLPQVAWLKTLDVSPEIRNAIAVDNAKRLLKLT
ncbi:MAG TPA: amidohydrolase family protein [Candidatus Hydrogenedentes bacterium]|nr:amidohydrolase family protein [Candidatus Hydrogenedentota bacterium]HOL76032.1 amidohydrolase family protein [Candidatus Hydrogenedentota bacterium]HPO84646.1 amidohydrolase family protein [Candidatus Hydrogenedentota bacterium]